MSRTLRGLMVSMMPSATAWRAKSALAQWVMCSPRAIGSRQASWMIWALWRGGNPLGMSRAGGRGQQAGEAGLLVKAADAPDGGGVALQAAGDALDRFAAGDRQDDTGALH